VGAQQEHRLDQVAARLLDGERRKFGIVERTLAHYAVDGERQLPGDLLERQPRHAGIATAARSEQAVGIGNGGFTTLDSYIHLKPPCQSAVCCAASQPHSRAQPGPGQCRAGTPAGWPSIAWRNAAASDRAPAMPDL